MMAETPEHDWPKTYLQNLKSRQSDVSGVVRNTASWLKDSEIGEESSADCCIVLAEALNNVVKHGYKGGPHGAIDVRIQLEESDITITIKDYGRPYILPTRNPFGDWKNERTDDLPESGFGWEILRYMTYHIELDREDSCNSLTLCIKLGGVSVDSWQENP